MASVSISCPSCSATDGVVRKYQIKSLSNVHKKIRKQVSVSGFLHSHWIGQLILN
ncbi:hypothetical protein FG949_02550 [Escherichia coli]|uniref:IS1 family transposase n=1 Tax=Escherichia coli TaxID=562 RepID=UPI001C702FC3|nr:hypothetical protein [Escherichia coli]